MNITLRLRDGYPETSSHHRPAVRELQAALNTKTADEIPVDGFFGAVTEEAVKRFQRHEGLVEDGIVGPITWAALLGRDAIIIPRYETDYVIHHTSLEAQDREAEKYRAWIRDSAEAAGVYPCVICGIGSRESSWGLGLSPRGPAGTGDYGRRTRVKPWRPSYYPPDNGGFGRGLMQIDFDAHEFARTGNWQDPRENILYAATVLLDAGKLIHRHWPSLSEVPRLRAMLAAYNCGAGNVLTALRTGRDVDYFTTGRDYSKDVLSRAGWFELKGW